MANSNLKALLRFFLVYFLFMVSTLTIFSKNLSVESQLILSDKLPEVSVANSTANAESGASILQATTQPTGVENSVVKRQQPNLTPTVVAESTLVENTSVPTEAPRDLFGEVALHNSSADCWIVYQGHIFNITSYFGSHPGGDGPLARYCGGDATAGFDSKDKNPPNPHSQAAYSMLSSFLIQ